VDLVAPKILDQEADDLFKTTAQALDFKADEEFLDRYVEYEWQHGRHIFERFHEFRAADRPVLEFGCFVGGSAIVLATMGARVTGIDIDSSFIELARLNAQRYGLGDRIAFDYVPDTTTLPFEDASFCGITCNSVLEYVPYDTLHLVLAELDRILAPGGVVVITGTSNRLWPREVHSGSWLTNYVPRSFDRFLGRSPRRGKFPRDFTKAFSNYENLDRADRNRAYLEMKTSMGLSPGKLFVAKTAGAALSVVGLTLGMLTPSISLVLRKPSGEIT